MASFHKIAIILIAVVCSCNVIKGDPNETLVYKICNGDTATSWAYNDEVNDLLQDIVDSTSDFGFNYYSKEAQLLVKTSFGHGVCNGLLSPPDCKTCLGDAKQLILKYCPLSVGAQLQLQDCRIRYEDYEFNEG